MSVRLLERKQCVYCSRKYVMSTKASGVQEIYIHITVGIQYTILYNVNKFKKNLQGGCFFEFFYLTSS